MVPKVSPLVETFLAVMGSRMPPHVIRQCWPVPHEEVPVQDITGVKEHIIKKLDEVTTCTPVKCCVGQVRLPRGRPEVLERGSIVSPPREGPGCWHMDARILDHASK